MDGAETPAGRVAAWRANALGRRRWPGSRPRAGTGRRWCTCPPSTSSTAATATEPYAEDAPIAPLCAYGASKAAGDLAVAGLERHYLVRPTWVVGEGQNFVRTMLGLAGRGISPTVVADQVGRPTFAVDIAAAIVHLCAAGAPYGTYHVTGGGEPASWADVAREVFAAAGRSELRVIDTSTAEYFANKPGAARRPLNSVLDCSKAAAVGVALPDWRTRLGGYVRAAG